MRLRCPHCVRMLEFTGDPPRFCAYCGKALKQAAEALTEQFDTGGTDVFNDAQQAGAHEAPTSIGGYRILRRLGGGGMGDVYEAEEASSGQRVAVKVIAPQFAGSETAVERFRQEGRLASLISHPRCVFVLAADEQEGLPYIVMELVSGRTLQQYVAERGPLRVEEAVSKILDVIDGLEEAHRLGVIHRDVKPSNCFLLDDGRVKIGDFGLSKSLVSGPDLTRTGTFLGTHLYAAPEQIKGDRVDFRSDIYSTTVTLYFLLTGQTPFQGQDAAATLARIVTEPPTPLRRWRPDISPALEKIIRRGLERNPERRWRSLADLRAALTRFVPARLSIGAMGLRAGAIVIDILLCSVLSGIVAQLFAIPAKDWTETPQGQNYLTTLVFDLVLILYFTIWEGLGGWTPGKWLLRLHVCRVGSSDPPGLGRTLWRTVLFYTFTNLVADLTSLLPADGAESTALDVVSLLSIPVGVLVLISSMRARNGYRGLHELLSGTRVVRLPWAKRPELFQSRSGRSADVISAVGSTQENSISQTVGPFAVRRTLVANGVEQLLLAEDPVLGRKVLLRCRPVSAGPLEATRRNLHRPTRLRWLSAGQQDGDYWDAFLAPAGSPLREVCDPAHRLSWRAYRGLLEQLTAELVAATADGTLPDRLDLDQVWVDPNGRVQLLDTPLAVSETRFVKETGLVNDDPCLHLLRAATRLALEGTPDENADTCRVRAPLPEHAARILRRLCGGTEAYRSAAELQTDLEETRDQLPEVNRSLRGVHLVVLAVSVGLPLLVMFAAVLAVITTEHLAELPTFARMQAPPAHETLVLLVLWFGFFILLFFPLLWVIWAFLFRGGLTLRIMGLALVRRDGRRAARWQCAWRAFLVWLPIALLLFLALAIKTADEGATLTAVAVWALAFAYTLACPALALWLPTRSVHDRLAGTFLVPQ